MNDDIQSEIDSLRPNLNFAEATALDALICKGDWRSDENQKGLDACIDRAKSLRYGKVAAWIMMERAMLSGFRPLAQDEDAARSGGAE